jgi:hypothetical protein
MNFYSKKTSHDKIFLLLPVQMADFLIILQSLQISKDWFRAPFKMTPFLGQNVTEELDKHHTHFLLFDDGKLGEYLTDNPRSDFIQNTCKEEKCYAVTIIVEGGLNTLEVITNDLKKKRPVVIVHGSGRLSDILSNLLENTSNSTVIGYTFSLFNYSSH